MFFNYQCFGTNAVLEPGDTFHIGVSSVPETYTKNHESAMTDVSIPGMEFANHYTLAYIYKLLCIFYL